MLACILIYETTWDCLFDPVSFSENSHGLSIFSNFFMDDQAGVQVLVVTLRHAHVSIFAQADTCLEVRIAFVETDPNQYQLSIDFGLDALVLL